MTTRDEPWPTGTPCWVDLVVDDVEAAADFYGELLGWTSEPVAGDAGYRMCQVGGRPTAGIGPRPSGLAMPSVWTTYLATDDAEKTARRIEAAGGSIMMEPFDVLEAGRMGVAFDPSGVAFGIWESRSHLGSSAVNIPGALTWNECMTRDYETSQEFYGEVFGHTYDEMGDGESFAYALIRVGGQGVGGLGQLGSDTPDEIPGHWMTYFAVDDPDSTAARATTLGAVVRMAPTDTPYGRMAVIEGTSGEVFAVITVVDAEAPARIEADSNGSFLSLRAEPEPR